MNILKDPQYASLRVFLIVVAFIGIGAFALKASNTSPLSQKGQVINGKAAMLTTLKTGVRNNAEVKALQTFLTKNKMFAGKIDGNFGKDTAEAVKKFQGTYKFKQSGTFGQSWVDENPSMMPPGDEVASCGIDFNEDGVTDVADLDMLLASFGSVGDNLSADLDNDQVVGASDIIILMGAYGTSANCMLTVSLTEGTNAINQAHIIEVDSTQDTDGVSLLAFTLENQGGQDFIIESIPVRFISTETTGNDPDDIATSVYLTLNGDVLDEKTLLATDSNNSTETVIFDGLDSNLSSDESLNFVVKVDVRPTNSTLDNGDTLRAEINDDERDGIDVENEEGDALLPTQRTGTAIGEASELRDAGIVVSLLSSSAGQNTNGMINFSFTLTATAFGSDVYIDKSIPQFDGTINTAGPDESDLNLIGGTGTLVIPNISAQTAEEGMQGYLIEEGDTEVFTIIAYTMPSMSGTYQMQLGNVAFALSDIDANQAYSVNLDDFITQAATVTIN
jgi:peptidoglycan hydrolase-like protein with peptidoglycan-binding domain